MTTKCSERSQKRTCDEASTRQGRNKRQKVSNNSAKRQSNAFTKNTIKDAGEMTGDGEFSSSKIKQFNAKTLCHPDQADVDLKEIFIKLWNRTGAEEWDEATASMFVERLLMHAVTILEEEYNCNLIVRREYPVKGRKNNGKPDLVARVDDAIVLVVEVKADNLELGIAQNLLQIRAAYQQNKRKRLNIGTTMYGLATTVSEWVLTKVVFKSNNEYTVSQTKPMALPIREKNISDIPIKDFKLIFGRVMWSMLETANKLKNNLNMSSM
jgi:hypothetical protein